MPDASIIVVTRNRKQTAERAVASAVAQEGSNEIVLFDDASTDGTAEYITARFPTVRVHCAREHAGYIVQRNAAARLATAPVIVSIDDDAVFTEPTIVRDTLRLFDHPRVGAVAIPFVNDENGRDRLMLDGPPDTSRVWVRETFVGTAYALRRDIFLRLGGFQELLYHWAEEVEYCQRLFGAGYVTAAGSSARIRHFPAGVGKYSRRVIRYLHRNRLLVAWLNVPAGSLLPMLAARTGQSIVAAFKKPSQAIGSLEGIAVGYGAMAKYWSQRRPLTRDAWRLWQEVWRRKLTPIDEIEPRLPVLQPAASASDRRAQLQIAELDRGAAP